MTWAAGSSFRVRRYMASAQPLVPMTPRRILLMTAPPARPEHYIRRGGLSAARGLRIGFREDAELLALFDHRRERIHDASAGEGRDHLGAEAQLREQIEAALVQVHDLLDDRQAKTRALFGG